MQPILQNAKDKEDADLIMRYYYESDTTAFNMLYERYSHKLHSCLRLKVGNTDLANDLCQATWNKVIDSKALIAEMAEHGILKFSAYLCTIAYNLWHQWNQIYLHQINNSLCA